MSDLTEEALRRQKIRELERSFYQHGRGRNDFLVDYPGEIRNVSEYQISHNSAEKKNNRSNKWESLKKPFHPDVQSNVSQNENGRTHMIDLIETVPTGALSHFPKIDEDLEQNDIVIHETELVLEEQPKTPQLLSQPSLIERIDDDADDSTTDIFESISRAVTARNKKKSQRNLRRNQDPLKNLLDTQTTNKQDHSGVSFIAALFQGPKETMIIKEHEDESGKDDDFLLALFISEPTGRRAIVKEEEGSIIGHFCARECPGFCQANFCIFHYHDKSNSS